MMKNTKTMDTLQTDLTPAQKRWMEYRFGIRYTFGINTFYNTETSEGTLDPSVITMKEVNVDQWILPALNAGMRYCVFTVKNHDGFCNWDTQHSFYNIMNTPFGRDILSVLAEACAANGMKLGLYYSLMDHYTSFKNDDDRFADMILHQVEELLNNYGEITQIWFDGFWDKQTGGWTRSPVDFVHAWRSEGAFRYKMDYLYRSIKAWQPDCMVMNHSTADFVGIPLHPVDARCGIDVSYVVVDKKYWNWMGRESYFPIEITINLSGKDSGKFNPGYWYWHEDDESIPDKERIYTWLELAERHEANLVLNCPISPQGDLRLVDQQLLESLWH